jgi:hypothetical protein
MPKAPSLRTVAALLLLSAPLGACVVYGDPYNGYYVGAVAPVAPPAPQVEIYGAPPTPGFLWIGGYWNWAGGRHVWVRGHWEAPRAGYHYVAHSWVHRGDGWHLARGHWERRR